MPLSCVAYNVRVDDRVSFHADVNDIVLHSVNWSHFSITRFSSDRIKLPPEIGDIELHSCDRSNVSLPSYIRLSRDF
jgi:hypothetical protein